MPEVRWGIPLPTRSELPALPKGVVLHWTGGGPKANSVDLAAYHYVVEADATVRAGEWPVAANMRKVSGTNYAAHTGGFNSFRIGISGAGMKDYASPANPGPFPLKEAQMLRMLEVAAYFLDLADLDPGNPLHLCTHLEVWTLHGIKGKQNHQKRDIEVLPFMPELKRDEVGPFLRQGAAEILLPAVELLGEPLREAEAGGIATAIPEPIVLPRGTVRPPSEELPVITIPWWRRILERVNR